MIAVAGIVTTNSRRISEIIVITAKTAAFGVAALLSGGTTRLPINVHAHSEPFDGRAVEAIVFTGRQICKFGNEERVVAEV